MYLSVYLKKENAVDFNESTAFVLVEVTGLELYTMLLVIKNIAVYCYIFYFITCFLYYFIYLKEKVCTFSVYF